MAWIRLDAATFEDRALRRAGMAGKVAFMAAVMLSKERDWMKDERRGWLPAREFDGAEVALHWSDSSPTAAAVYDDAIRALSAGEHPLLIWDGDGWWVANWDKYQPDPTALARKRKERAERWRAELHVTGRHSDKRKSGERHSDNRDKADAGSNGRAVVDGNNGCHRDDRDVTARDVHAARNETRRDESRSRDETSHVSMQEGGEGGAAPSPARPGAEAVAAPTAGIAIRDGYVPGSLGDPTGLPDPAAKAREIRDALLHRPPPAEPMRGPDIEPEPRPRVADQGKIERLKAETLAKIAELERDDGEEFSIGGLG